MIRYLLLVLCAAPLAAQPAAPTDWRAYPPLADIVALDARDGTLWAAASGGVVRYDPATGEVETFTTVQGLFGREATALAAPAGSDDVWIGYASGTLDRLDAATGEVERFRDIARAVRFAQRGVTRITAAGQRLYLATDFGVVVFDPSEGLVRETYSRFADLPSATRAFDVALVDERVYVATAEGLAQSVLDGRNLQDPAAWTVTLRGTRVNAVAVLGGRLYAGTDTDLLVRADGGAWQPLGVTGSGVRTLARAGDRLIGIEGNDRSQALGLIAVDGDGSARRVRAGVPAGATDAARVGGDLWIGARGAGLVRGAIGAAAFDEAQRVVPPGPATALFTDLDFEPDGTLWAAGNDVGLFRLGVGGEWTQLDIREATGRAIDDVVAVAVAADGGVYAGTQGDGIVYRAPDGTLTVFDRDNSTLRTPTGIADPFEIVEGLDVDASGALWATNKFTARALQTRQPGGTWSSLPNPTGDGLRSDNDGYTDLIVDSFGQKWIVVQDERDGSLARGLMVYDTGADPADPSDDAFRLFTRGPESAIGLPSTNVTDVAEGRDGRIWAATDEGVAFLLNNGITARDPAAQFNWPGDTGIGRFPLQDVNATAIGVDLGGGVWVGSDNGLFVLRETGGQFPLVARYTTANAPLPSDRIVAIETNPATGAVFVATDGGLVSFEGAPDAPVAEAGDLRIFPNPARPADAAAGITVSGLVDQTQIRFLTADGRLVWQDATRGGSYVWDGRDLRGEPVAPGVYLVVAVDADGGAGYGRVAVLR